MTVADWYANAAAPGCDLAVTTPNWNVPAGDTIGPHPVSLYTTTVALDPGKQVSAVTLPGNGSMHVFAAAIG